MPNHSFDLGTWAPCGTLNVHWPKDSTKPYPQVCSVNKNGKCTKQYNWGAAPGANVDYTYDSSTHVVTWVSGSNPNVQNVVVNWDYDIPPTPGKCGVHTSDPNAVCLVVSWQGYRTGGINPGPGPDFGERAIRLSA